MADIRREPVRCCVKVADWPTIDQLRWHQALSAPSSLDGPALTEKYRPATLRKAEAGYGRWIGFLRTTAELDAESEPGSRVNAVRMRRYFAHLRDLANRDFTVIARIKELEFALRILEPDRDFGWLLSPGGRPVHCCLPMIRKDQPTPDPGVVFQAALDLAREAIATPWHKPRRTGVRDALMIAIVASRGIRLKSLTEMQLGQNLVRNASGYRLAFSKDEIKTKRAFECGLPEALTWLIDRYLDIEREELLGGHTCSSLWIVQGGGALAYHSVGCRMKKWSQKMFGQQFGFHRLRHGIASSAIVGDPNSTGVVAAVLGITEHTLTKHYDLSASPQAGRAVTACLSKRRESTAARAARAYSGQDVRRIGPTPN